MLKLILQAILTFFTCLFILSKAQTTNTHQTIIKTIPNAFKMNLKQNDTVKISVYNVNAQVQLVFNIQSKQIAYVKKSTCFMGQQCALQFVSDYNVSGVGLIRVNAYSYSYQILHNGKIFQKKQNVIDYFLQGKFLYSKHLKPKTYQLQIIYQSKKILNLVLNFMGVNYQIYANQKNNVNITFNQTVPFYQFHFGLQKNKSQTILQQFFEIIVKIPNQMLKGCDGTNHFDPKTRICPVKNLVKQDQIYIHKLGQYPTFSVAQKQKTIIKITIVEGLKWKQFFSNQSLTIFVSNISNPKQFNNLTRKQLTSKYRTKQQCQFKGSICTYIFKLQPGNYTIMPVMLQAGDNMFTYLYERSDGQRILQSYYSILPYQSEEGIFNKIGGIVQFYNRDKELTQMVIQCKDKFILMEYTVMGRSNIVNDQGFQIQVVEMYYGLAINQNLTATNIYLQLQKNTSYLFVFMVLSQQKFALVRQNINRIQQGDQQQLYYNQTKRNKQIKQGQQDEEQKQIYNHGQKQMQQISQQMNLQTQTLKLSIKNGKFPHKKIQQKQNQFIEGENSQDTGFIHYTLIVVIGIIVFIVLVLTLRKIINKSNNKNKQKELVQEQVSDTNAVSTTIQLPQTSKSSQISHKIQN